MTGFSSHVLRKWEQRFSLLSPQRAKNGYRLFDQIDLQLLLFIKHKLGTGCSIGQLAHIGRGALLAEMNSGSIDISHILEDFKPQAVELIQAARRGDSGSVEQGINLFIQKLSFESALINVFFPILRSVGELWHHGRISVSGEQLVSYPIHRLLAEHNHLHNGTTDPQAIVACVPNDFHEIGPMSAARLLRHGGWRATYLGPDSNIDMVHLACRRRRAKLVLLSCVVEPSKDAMKLLIEDIVRQLLPITTVAIGGKGASLYIDWLERKGIRYIGEIEQVSQLTPRSLGHSRIA